MQVLDSQETHAKGSVTEFIEIFQRKGIFRPWVVGTVTSRPFHSDFNRSESPKVKFPQECQSNHHLTLLREGLLASFLLSLHTFWTGCPSDDSKSQEANSETVRVFFIRKIANYSSLRLLILLAVSLLFIILNSCFKIIQCNPLFTGAGLNC